MPLTDQARIAAEREQPRVVALWQALTALRSVISFMNTGAHPDDETSGMLAAMRFRDGIDISYACSTRGEGGQNDIGTESGAALGVLRTAEMEAACDRLDLRMYWLSQSPDDTIFDFGFSKSGIETMERWGRDRTLARMVHIIRTERPDIICPTFLDVPGQHGHHRAMTEAALAMMELAADNAYPGCDLAPWEIKKIYLPAWSGAGQSYDDDLPPPPATVTVAGKGDDPVTGWRFANIGQHSRVMHATQGMGRWLRAGAETDYPLHLAASRLPGPDVRLETGLARTLRELDVPSIAGDLAAAQDRCDAAVAAFPDLDQIIRHACDALAAVRRAQADCPQEALPAIGHKLLRKEQQLSRIIHLASGVRPHARLASDVLYPGGTTTCEVETNAEDTASVVTLKLPEGWRVDEDRVQLDEDAPISDPYPDVYLPGFPGAPCVEVSTTVGDLTVTTSHPFEIQPVVMPRSTATPAPDKDIINLAKDGPAATIKILNVFPTTAQTKLIAPEGWQVTADKENAVTVTPPSGVNAGLYRFELTADGVAAMTVQHVARAHVAPRILAQPAVAQIRVLEAALPDVRVGYVGGGHDRVCHWLRRLGVDVTDLSEIPLTPALLATFDSLVIGIFAMKSCPGLADAMPSVHAWTRAGGTLVTLYHRPWDGWDPASTAPYYLEIGQPSLRWRVTDERAEVTALVPDHPLLNFPNRIVPTDWDGWHKERGLYFAKKWDSAYTPLFAMHDAGEAPLKGALLAADVGHGRHVHTSLILHHQMNMLVPGAFRIMANLIAKRG